MLKALAAEYKKQDNKSAFFGSIHTDTFFCVVDIPAGYDAEQGEELLAQFREEIEQISISNLNRFEAWVHDVVVQANVPVDFSLAAAVLHEDVLYLKTTGTGGIYLRRGDDFATLIHGDKSASGYPELDDCFVFATDSFASNFYGNDELKLVVAGKNPDQIIHAIENHETDKDENDNVALFVQFEEGTQETQHVQESPANLPSSQKPSFSEQYAQASIADRHSSPQQEEQTSDEEESSKDDKGSFFSRFGGIKDKMKLDTKYTVAKKKWGIIVAIILFALLGWSVFFSYQRVEEQKLREKIESSQELITEKLQQSEEISFLNPQRSVLLLDEARNELQTLKSNLTEEEQEKLKYEIDALEQRIGQFETEVTKKEEKEYTEFFDLTLEEESAVGTDAYVYDGTLAVVDPGNQIIYLLDMEQKSIDKLTSPGIEAGTQVAMYLTDVYFFTPGKGIYRFLAADETEKLIDNDDEWGEIVDFETFYGNMYLLDPEVDDIYKYLVIENGYAGKTSYFDDTFTGSVANATSMAIDSSVYVSLGDEIVKYTSGLEDEFNTAFPTQDISISQIYSDEVVDKVYAWDKAAGSIFVLGKNGRYEREIYTEMLKEADDFVAYEDNIYVVSGSKIYEITDSD